MRSLVFIAACVRVLVASALRWHELPMGTPAVKRGTNTPSLQALTRPGAAVMQLKPVLLHRR